MAQSQMAIPQPGSHGHPHAHAITRDALRLGFFLTLAILLVELAGGLLSHSLALLSDAGHMFTDVIALGLAWFAAAQAERPPSAQRTFGYHRVGIIVAFVNGLTLVAIAIVISVEAWNRLQTPQDVQPNIMVAAAFVAIAVNLFIVQRLHGSEDNLNVRASALHILGDIGASLAVVIGAIAIAFTGAAWVDPIISAGIAILIAVSAVRVIREAGGILMEAAPADISSADVVHDICHMKDIRGIHDLHIWTITSGIRALSCHVLIDDIPPSASAHILDQVSAMLQQRYRIAHTTIQFESDCHEAHDGFCACEPGMAEDHTYCALTRQGCDHSHPHA